MNSTRTKNYYRIGLTLAILAMVAITSLAGAVNVRADAPDLPSNFYGYVQFVTGDGEPAVDTTLVVEGAGISASTKIVATGETPPLGYVINVPGVIATDAGKPLTFKINGRVVLTNATWSSGTNISKNLHPPQALPGGPYTGTYGVPVTLTASANDLGNDVSDSTGFMWDLDHNGTYETAGKSVSNTWTSVGTHIVGLQVTDGQGGVGTATVEVTVGKATATVTLDDLNQTYDGAPKAATVTTVPAGLTVSVTYAGSTTAPTAAGSYAVVATITDPNYSGSVSDTLVIDKATSSTLVSGGGMFEYDGLPHPATVAVTGAGGLSLTPAPVYSCSTAPVNVADTPCSASYTFAGDDNHYGSTGSATITITQAAATVTLSNLSYVFDGTPKSATVTTVPDGLSVSITYGGSPTAPTDPGSYAVVATITDPNYSGSASDTLVIYAKHSIPLVTGWNLVSFNLIPTNPATGLVDTKIEDVLAGLSTNFDQVFAWDATGGHSGVGNWLGFTRGVPFGNSLTDLTDQTGFWIHMTAPAILDVVGNQPTTTTIALHNHAGNWNLVGYPARDNKVMPGVFAGSGINLAFAYHASDVSDPWKLYDAGAPSWSYDLTSLDPGWGYWVYTAVDGGSWTVTYP